MKIDINWALLSPELALIGGALVIFIVDLIFRRRARYLHLPLAIITLAVASWLLSSLGWNYQSTVADSFFTDRAAIFFKLIVYLGTFIILLLAEGYRPLSRYPLPEFTGLILLAASAMSFMVSSKDLILLYVSIEFASIVSYILAGYMRDNVESAEAGLKYFLFGASSSAVMLMGFALLFYVSGGVTNLPAMGQALVENNIHPAFIIIAFGLVAVGLSYKVGAVPIHGWVPDTYQGAPTPIAAFLSVSSKVAGIAVLLRIIIWLLPQESAIMGPWTMILSFSAMASMILGTTVGILQMNLKRLLAYSAIAHIGFVLIGIIVGMNYVTYTGNDFGKVSVLIYVAGYLFMNLGAFAIVNMIGNATGGYELHHYRGLASRKPVLALLLAVFLLALAGIPPTVGFIAKFYVLAAAINADFIALAVVGILTSVVSLFLYARVLKVMYMDKPPKEEIPSKPIPAPSWAAVGLCLLGTLLWGIYPGPLIHFAKFCVKQIWLQ